MNIFIKVSFFKHSKRIQMSKILILFLFPGILINVFGMTQNLINFKIQLNVKLMLI